MEEKEIKQEATAASQPQQAVSTELAEKPKYTPELCAAAISKLPSQLAGIKNCFAKPFDSFRNAFKDPKEADRVMAKEIEFASQAMLSNNYLITCAQKNPMDLVNALKNIALTGFSLNPTLKQGYLVPFNSKVTFMPSYMGLVDMLMGNGFVKKIEAHTVHEGDIFEIEFGANEHLVHKPNPWSKKTKDNLLGAYYFAVLADGTEVFDTMSKEEIEAIRKRAPSASGKSSPWDTDYMEMAKKTLIRRAFKMIPKNGISEDKIKVLETSFGYDEEVEKEWIKTKAKPSVSSFDEDGIVDVEPEELN